MRRNAASNATLDLARAWREFDGDATVRAVLVRGGGRGEA